VGGVDKRQHPYLSALWGADSPEVARQVREHAKLTLPEFADLIDKHLSDSTIEQFWNPRKKQ